MPASTAITAAICTYQRHELLEKAIDSLLAQTLATDAEILVVDNSPPCAAGEALKRRYSAGDRVRYLIEPTPGLANARNVAASQASSPLIAYIDDDAIARPDWLEQVVRAFHSFGGEAGVVGGRVLPLWTTQRPSWLPDELLTALTIVDWGGSLRLAKPSEPMAGTNLSFRVEALQATGGFSMSLGRVGLGHVLLSNEDTDLVQGLERMGHKTVWAPDAVVEHLVHPDRLQQRWFRSRMAWQAVSDLLTGSPDIDLDVERYWRGLAAFVSELPPRHRTPRGLFQEIDDPELFSRQVHAIYGLTMLSLLGFHRGDD